MYSLPQLKGTANFCQQVWQRELNVPPQHQARSFRAHLYRERLHLAKNLYKFDLRAHFGCVNAIEFSRCGELLASAGDDKRVLVWNVEKSIANIERPHAMTTEHSSNIFCLGFDSKNDRLLSGGNDDLVILHDIKTRKLVSVYKHDSPVYGLSMDPTCDHVFATACEDGQILLFDQRLDPVDPFVIAEVHTSFHAVEFHPISGRYLVTANSKRGAAFWDIRKPNAPVIKYGYPHDPFSCMSARFNSNGTYLLALRRRRPPVLYKTDSSEPVATFFHAQYYNSCTMKSCTFAGEDDELVLSGSDDFNLYAWRMNDLNLEGRCQWVEKAHMVLYGHRSIVNQVRYNRQKCILASSGVEKIVKLWSPFEQKGWTGSLTKEASGAENPRELYLPRGSNSGAGPPHSWSYMSHDYSSRNTNEDPRMMAFFDSLIQQEIEGWDLTSYLTDSDANSARATANESSTRNSSINGSSSSSTNSDDDDNDNDRVTISLSNTLDDVPSAVEAQETEPCTESDRRYQRNLARSLRLARKENIRSRLRSPIYTNRIAYLIATKQNVLRRLAKRGMKKKPCTCRPNRVPRLKQISEPQRPQNRPSFTRIIRIPSSNNVNNRIVNGNSNVNNHNSINDGSQLSWRKMFRKFVPSLSPTSSSDDSYTSTISSTSASVTASSSTYQSTIDDDDLANPVPSTSSRAVRMSRSNNVATPSTSTGRTSSIADIARLRQNQQQILVSDDDDESEDEDDAVASLALSRSLGSRAQLISEILPPKKLNGVRRLNDELIGSRRSNRLLSSASYNNAARVASGAEHENGVQDSRDVQESTEEETSGQRASSSGTGGSGMESSGGSGGDGNGRDNGRRGRDRQHVNSVANFAEEAADEDEDEAAVVVSVPADASLETARTGGRNRLRRARELRDDYYAAAPMSNRNRYVSVSALLHYTAPNNRSNNIRSLHDIEQVTTYRSPATQSCPIHGIAATETRAAERQPSQSNRDGCCCTTRSSRNSERVGRRREHSRSSRNDASPSSSQAIVSSAQKRCHRDDINEATPMKRRSKQQTPPPPISPSPPLTDSDTPEDAQRTHRHSSRRKNVKHKCSKHRKREAQKRAENVEDSQKRQARSERKTQIKKKRHEHKSGDRDKSNVCSKKHQAKQQRRSDNVSPNLSDEQPTTSAAALAALASSNRTPDHGVCDSTATTSTSSERCRECGSIKPNRGDAVSSSTRSSGGSGGHRHKDDGDDYRRKMERVKRVYAKYFESDSD